MWLALNISYTTWACTCCNFMNLNTNSLWKVTKYWITLNSFVYLVDVVLFIWKEHHKIHFCICIRFVICICPRAQQIYLSKCKLSKAQHIYLSNLSKAQQIYFSRLSKAQHIYLSNLSKAQQIYFSTYPG